MVIYPTDLDPSLTQEETDFIINNLILNPSEFSRFACLDGRASGVITLCDECDIEINKCVQEHIITNLISSQETVESIVNYPVTERYKSVTFPWDGVSRIRIDCGLQAIGVTQSITSQDTPVVETISYPLISDVPTVDSGSNYCIASLDGEIVKNPNKIIFRNASTNEVIPTQNVNGFPKKIGGDWQVALGQAELPPCSTTIDAYHCNLVRVTTPEVTPTSGTIAPVFPGTNQIIPQALPSELVDSDVNRAYWFYVWEFVNPDFKGEEINLVNGDYYKLIETIEFKIVDEVETDILVEYSQPSTTVDGDVTVTNVAAVGSKIISDRLGVIEVYPDPAEECTNGCIACSCKVITGLTISYKVDPSILGVNPHVMDVKEAIAYLTAAELPLSSCGCEIKKGFIAKAQEAYTETRVNPITGEAIINLKHGNLYGQLVFSEKIDRLLRLPKITYL